MIIAVVGLLREARIVAGPDVRVVVGGADATGLARRLEEAIKEPSPQGGGAFQGVLSFGVAGALSPSLQPGDVVVASAVRDGAQRFETHSAWTRAITAALPHAVSGSVAGSDAMLVSPEAKAALHGVSGAVAVDMESHIAARFAAAHDLPLAVIRAISDGADHALPPAAQRGMKPDGGMDIGAVLRALAADPRQLPALIRTGMEAEKGFSVLVDSHHRLRRARVLGDLGHHALDMA